MTTDGIAVWSGREIINNYPRSFDLEELNVTASFFKIFLHRGYYDQFQKYEASQINKILLMFFPIRD